MDAMYWFDGYYDIFYINFELLSLIAECGIICCEQTEMRKYQIHEIRITIVVRKNSSKRKC